jgi:3-methyl-2-oxobutanoate hydroxymethyltransferase
MTNSLHGAPAQPPPADVAGAGPAEVTNNGQTVLYGGVQGRRVTIRDLQLAKARGERWPMLTAYDFSTARVFDDAGIPVLLVGDSAANVVYGYDSTVPVEVDELLPLVRGVVRGARRALIVADLPFGSYQASATQALATATRFLKEGGAQAVKLEGGERVAPQVEALVAAGIPVMAHLGLTPQSVNTLSGYRVQGRGAESAHRLLTDAKALEQAGAFAVVLEVVPAELAAQVTAELAIPTVGIGAGAGVDAQVLVWQDMAGLHTGDRAPAKFVKAYADLTGVLGGAARQFGDEVRSGGYPAAEHSYH